MMDFKKRALILTLAATVSVTGSFAADNYKNCLMNMEFQPVSDNEIRLILNTKNNYDGSITPLRKDASTFIIMLPEMDNRAFTPDLTKVQGAIESVEISKMPYANGSKGYTKILVKTAGVINLNASTALYVPSKEDEMRAIEEQKKQEELKAREEKRKQEELAAKKAAERAEAARQAKLREEQSKLYRERNYQSESKPVTVPVEAEPKPVPEDDYNDSAAKTPELPVTNDAANQQYLLLLAIILVIMISTVIYIKSREKMANVLGENLKIDINDDEEEDTDKKSQKKRKHQISRSINRLDHVYKNSVLPFNNTEYTASVSAPKQEAESEKEMNIVDLDALFKEKQSQETEETSALDEFLSGFSFDDGEESTESTESEKTLGYDEEEYEDIINNTDIKFSKEDIVCFNELLQSEISDDVIKNMENYNISNPIKHKNRQTDKILEKLVSSYMISQNITFTHDDIEILRKLITVEIDSDFVTDLRTNPELTKEMEKSIIAGSTKKKPSEILTLNVKDMLPNLSDALKKQGRKPIVSEVQPEVVYYSEGYDVDKLVLDFDLPDLSKEIKNKKAYMEKPSYSGDTVDQSYADSVQKLQTSGLPDLKDVVAHPKKYAEPKKKEFIPDEKSLLSNLMNVQFKPFDDGTRKFEIINDIEEENEDTISISTQDIQNEFSRFKNFELASEEDIEPNYSSSDYDDFENIYKQDFVDLDKNALGNISATDILSNEVQNEQIYEQENLDKELDIPKIKMDTFPHKKTISNKLKKTAEKFVLKDLDKKRPLPKRIKDQENSEKLISILEKFRYEKKNKKITTNIEQDNKKVVNKTANIQPQPLVKCILDGINYDVIASSAIDEHIGCHLVKSEKVYRVLAYKDSELSVLKEYVELKAEKLFVRLSETLDDGTPRYLVKVGSNKFIIDIIDGQVRYVMDLC